MYFRRNRQIYYFDTVNINYDIKEIGVRDYDTIDANKLQSRYRHCQNTRQQFRNRKEYLAELVQKSKRKQQVVRQGEFVLI